MRIGIDISQIDYHGGVAIYTQELVRNLVALDRENEYVLFGSSDEVVCNRYAASEFNQLSHKVGPDESRPTCYENPSTTPK